MKHIAIEGNIGAGKTTLAKVLASSLNASLLLEEFAENSFLPKFYAEPGRYAFPLELSFLADRYRQVKSLAGGDLFRTTLISDYLFIKSKLFARINLEMEEYRLFCRLYDIMDADVPKPDILIFLYTPVPVLQDRIAARGRSFEKGITDEYLARVGAMYETYLRECGLPVLYIDSTAVDFAGSTQSLTMLLQVLEEFAVPGIRYLTFD